jgi:hypothetical protein
VKRLGVAWLNRGAQPGRTVGNYHEDQGVAV